MLSKLQSFSLIGLEGQPVDIEVDIRKGMPKVEIVGLADTAVKESKERVRLAIRNSGFSYPVASVVVNLAPADVKKEGAMSSNLVKESCTICPSHWVFWHPANNFLLPNWKTLYIWENCP